MGQYLAMFFILGIGLGILIGFIFGYNSCEKVFKEIDNNEK